MKYLILGVLVAALAVGVLAMPAQNVSAAYYGGYGYGLGGYNDIASWIVLDGLFNPRVGVDGAGAPATYDPISSWIVLDGLFGGPSLYYY